MAFSHRIRPPLGGRFRFGAALGAALFVVSCASGDRPPAPQASDAPAAWGDRTVAMTYPDGDPLVAYFTAGRGEGRLFVWDGGESAIARGDWRMDDGRLCMSLAVLRRDSAPKLPLRAREPVCMDPADPRIAGRSYRGDAFSLQGLTEAPYILSQADNERLLTVLHDAERMGR